MHIIYRKIQLIKQVLLEKPIYHMMYTYLQKSTVSKIERLCKEFLWGHNKQGGQKVSLVVWSRLTKMQKHGGLGIKDTSIQATALMARWPIKLILNKNSTWSKLFKANLDIIPWANKKKTKNWDIHSRIKSYSVVLLGLGNFNIPKISGMLGPI
jgi:hypothetical protein